MRRFVAGSQGRAIAFAAIYSVLILAVALIGEIFCTNGRQHHGRSSLSVITDLSAYIQDGAEGVTPSSVEGGDDALAVPAGEQPGQDDAQWVNVPALNVLLLGTDARPDEADVPRTDTMILASLDPQSQSLGLL